MWTNLNADMKDKGFRILQNKLYLLKNYYERLLRCWVFDSESNRRGGQVAERNQSISDADTGYSNAAVIW